jgi:hypothetical protein
MFVCPVYAKVTPLFLCYSHCSYIKLHKVGKVELSPQQAVEAPIFCLHNRLTDGGKVVSLRRRPPFTPKEDSWYSFLFEAESTPGP